MLFHVVTVQITSMHSLTPKIQNDCHFEFLESMSALTLFSWSPHERAGHNTFIYQISTFYLENCPNRSHFWWKMTAILNFRGQWEHWRNFHGHHVKERIKIPLHTKFHPFILKNAKISPLLGKNNKKSIRC